ncbi:MAG: NAD-dependent epimerase/dehydratase family protein [Granulosicoccus sp.]
MKVLVTGASSLIGRHVIKLLLHRGDNVTVVQRGASGLDNVEEIRCDLSADSGNQQGERKLTVGEALAQGMCGADAVVHLAAKVSVSGRWDAFEALNVEGTRRVIQASIANQVPRFVHVSSPSVAHAGRSLVAASAGPADPAHVSGHYARSKAMGEQIALAANSDRMKVLSLRPHLVWGPGDQQLVQRIIDRASSGRLQLVGSGQAFIDTTYIDNAASAIVAGIDNIDVAAGHALVISNGQPRTVSEIIHRILLSAGMRKNLRHVPTSIAITAGTCIERLWQTLDRQDDPPMTRFLAEQLATAHWFDQRQTRALLNWQPAVGLDEGFDRLTEFFQSSSLNTDT